MPEFNTKTMKKLYLLPFLLISLSGFAQAPPLFYPSTWPKILGEYNDTMMNGLCGGFNNPMFYSMDLNGDGALDLVVFERSDNSVHTFINNRNKKDPQFYYDPQYETAFPKFNYWAELYDFNHDGKPDMFNNSTDNSTGVQVFENTSTPGHISFTKYADPLGCYYGDSVGLGQLNINNISSPAFGDLDSNGATDILAFDASGAGPVDYYRNYIKDKDTLAAHPYIKDKDSLYMGLASCYWGKFFIANQSSAWTLHWNDIDTLYSLQLPGPHKTSSHIGATTLMIDIDGDGDQDLLMGDYDDPHMYLFKNGRIENGKKTVFGGNPNTMDVIDEVDTWPTATAPVMVHSMPGAYSLDVDNDGVNDLLISPYEITVNSSAPYNIDRHNFVWYYKNTGTNKHPDYVFQQNDYMEENMLDLGVHAAPCFIDYNNDGLPDMIVATTYKESAQGYHLSGDDTFDSLRTGLDRLELFENVGTKTKAVYRLVDTDYMSISKDSLFNIVPTVGDLDGDGKPDLVLGSYDGRLEFYKNVTVSGNLLFKRVRGVLDSIAIFSFAGNTAPAIGDIDMDGNADLLVGAKDQYIRYYRNIGKKGSPIFSATPTNPSFGGIDTRYTYYYPGDTALLYGNYGLGTPCLADINKDGKLDLIVGTGQNGIMLYLNVAGHGAIGQALTRTNNIIFDKWSNAPGNKIMGGSLAVAVAQLDDDTMPDIMVGCERGGLMFLGSQQHKVDTIDYESIKPVAAQKLYNFSVYPNPTKTSLTIKYAGNESLPENMLTIADMTGKIVLSQQINLGPDARTKQINLAGFTQGVYLLNIYSKDGARQYYGKVIVD